MKTAILLCGNIRTLDKCKRNILETFSHLNPDYFVSTYYNKNQYHPCVKHSIGCFDDKLGDYYSISKQFEDFDPKRLLVDTIEEANNFYNSIGGGEFNVKTGVDYSSGYLQFWKIGRCLDELDIYESRANIKYDCVFKIRCDLLFKSSNIKSLDYENLDKKFYINLSVPNCYNDQIFVSSKENIRNINNEILNNFFNYIDQFKGSGESLLKKVLDSSGLVVEQRDLLDYIVRENNILINCS